MSSYCNALVANLQYFCPLSISSAVKVAPLVAVNLVALMVDDPVIEAFEDGLLAEPGNSP